jgi:hypothetical protein
MPSASAGGEQTALGDLGLLGGGLNERAAQRTTNTFLPETGRRISAETRSNLACGLERGVAMGTWGLPLLPEFIAWWVSACLSLKAQANKNES